MKLTQAPARPAEPAPAAGDVTDRLGILERRLAQLELMPAPAPSTNAPAPAGAFDQKVLEAVVKALDARLQEQAGQVERRLTELEAKITIELQSLRQQDQSIAKGVQAGIGDLQRHFSGRLDAVRKELEDSRTILRQEALGAQHAAAESAAAAARIESLRTGDDQVHEELRQEIDSVQRATAEALKGIDSRAAAAARDAVRPVEERMREELRQSIGRATSLIASASEAAVQEKLAPVEKRVAESGRQMAALLEGIGALCRETAERMAGPGGGPAEPPAAVPPSDTAPPPAEDSLPKQDMEAQVLPTGIHIHEIPAFAQVEKPGKLWRVPLVSSLAALGAFVGAHLPLR